MKVLKCENGHHYDADKYIKCPVCIDEGLIPDDGENRRFIPAKMEEESYPKHTFADKTMPLSELEANKEAKNDINSVVGKTVDIFHYEEDHCVDVKNSREVESQSEPKREENSAFMASVQKAAASGSGKTVGFFSSGNSSKNNSEANDAPNASVAPVDPVVGWIVCIHGAHFGESFNIAAGKNSIGRSENNKIILYKDNSISREKHALIIYEPKKRQFYIQPGDSSGLTYLNEEYITESTKISAKDILELGNSKFIFVPLCDESFSWDNYITKE